MSTPLPSRRRLRALSVPVLAAAVAMSLPGVANGHEFDHSPPGGTAPNAPFSYAQSGGQGATWRAVTSIPTGNSHTDIDFFTKAGETYASVGTLAAGGNRGGQSIVKLTDGGKVVRDNGSAAPVFVAGHPSATCVSDPNAALGLQHDVEATPKGDTINNDSYLPPVAEDAQLIIDATDGRGRCHDQGTLGISGAPLGGLEIIDITALGEPGFRPREIALTSHVGQAHTVNIDPARPHIAYSVTSDGVGVTADTKGTADTADDTFVRNNETTQTNNLDGFEVVDLSSCMYKTAAVPAGTLDPAIKEMTDPAMALAAKREACKPQVYRYRYESLDISQGHTIKTGIFGCHELKPYPDDKLTCGSGAAAIVFDMSGAFDENGKPQGTPLECSLRNSSSTSGFTTGAKITDCTVKPDGTSLGIPQWLKDGAPSLTGVKHLGSVHHIGRAAATGFANTIPATEDIDFNHETEFTRSGRFLLATDERGGGVTGGAQCTQGQSNPQVNGGVHAYRVDKLTPSTATTTERAPGTPEVGHTGTKADADAAYARSFSGRADDPATADRDESVAKSIYRAPTRTGAEGSFCTAHVLQQVPDQTRIFMGWYTQGTQVLDYVELPGHKLQFIETGFAIPAGAGGVKADTWVSHVFKSQENEDGTFTYFGLNGDITRASIDIFSVTMPEPLTACDLKAGTATRAMPSTVSDRDQARDVHKENVDCVLNYKISSGKTVDAAGVATSYAPREDVTRGQMARFVANAIDASGAGDSLPAATGGDRFSDIGTNTHRAAINRLAQAGIVRGDGTGRFNPEERITRAQMATFIVEAARVAGGRALVANDLTSFSDVPSSSVHARNINAGFEAGLFRGTVAPEGGKPGAFSPAVNVPRDQMASFLVELFTQSIR